MQIPSVYIYNKLSTVGEWGIASVASSLLRLLTVMTVTWQDTHNCYLQPCPAVFSASLKSGCCCWQEEGRVMGSLEWFELEGPLKAIWSHSLQCTGIPTARLVLRAPSPDFERLQGWGIYHLSKQPTALPLSEKDFYLISNRNLPPFILKRSISRPCSPNRAVVRPLLPISLLQQHHLFMLKSLSPLNDKSSSSWWQRQEGCSGADRAHPSPLGLSPSLTQHIAWGSSHLSAFSSLSLPFSSRQSH